MRSLIVSEFVTLDGVMEAPGGEPTHPHTNWVGDHPGGTSGHFDYKLEEILAAEILLLGRVTYESFAGAWPDREGEFAVKLNGMRKVVVSGTLKDPDWNNTTVLRGDLVAGVSELKAGDGGPILVHGSQTLVHGLLDNNLVDELRLMVFPVTIGAGGRVFSDTIKKTPWVLADSIAFASKVRVDVHHPA
ncbi:MAG: dihydrofolate reductase family protein [Acidimicrobiia bacterium]